MRRALLSLPLLLVSCFHVAPSRGGGQRAEGRGTPDPAAVALPDGYVAEVVATGLDFPTGVAFDAAGRPHVTLAGYAYGEVWGTPRLVRIEPGGAQVEVARGERPPWNGVAFHDGAFYVAEGGERGGGRIVRVGEGGALEPLVSDLPTLGDHHANGPAIGPDGLVYFSTGTATNAGVVGVDNWDFGWLRRHPELHDVPCEDVTLTGAKLAGPDPRTDDPDDQVETGPYQPLGQAAPAGTVIHGRLPCSGAVFRVAPAGGAIELVAWGFRNPFGLAFAPDGALHVTDNGYDERGSRPVFGAADVLWAVERGRWYGWPDFAEGISLEEERWSVEGKPGPSRLLETKERPPEPAARFGVHSSSNGLDFSRSEAFGHVGQAFVAQFGDMAPNVGKVMAPVGFQVVRVDVRTGVIAPFAANRDGQGPASKVGGGGLERPNAARFDPSGAALWVVDFGELAIEGGGAKPKAGTGVLWKIRRSAP